MTGRMESSCETGLPRLVETRQLLAVSQLSFTFAPSSQFSAHTVSHSTLLIWQAAKTSRAAPNNHFAFTVLVLQRIIKEGAFHFFIASSKHQARKRPD